MKDDATKRGTPQAVSNPPAKMLPIYLRDSKAAELRRAGYTWEDIAAESRTWDFGATPYGTRANAFNAVKKRMIEARELAYGEAELYRVESLERLTDLLKAVWPMAMRGSDKHVESARRIIKQMGDLRGENMPIQIEMGMSDVDRLLRDALDEFNKRAGESDREASADQGDEVSGR